MTGHIYPISRDEDIRAILLEYKSFAMVGASANKTRPSYFAMKYLLGKGYHIIPVNPAYAGESILGQTVYPTLSDIPGEVEIVDIFRQGKAALDITHEAVAIGAKVVWMQIGVKNDEAAEVACSAGLKLVVNRCPKIEYGRFSGEISWTGVNSGIISSVRPQLTERGYQQRIIKERGKNK